MDLAASLPGPNKTFQRVSSALQFYIIANKKCVPKHCPHAKRHKHITPVKQFAQSSQNLCWAMKWQTFCAAFCDLVKVEASQLGDTMHQCWSFKGIIVVAVTKASLLKCIISTMMPPFDQHWCFTRKSKHQCCHKWRPFSHPIAKHDKAFMLWQE